MVKIQGWDRLKRKINGRNTYWDVWDNYESKVLLNITPTSSVKKYASYSVSVWKVNRLGNSISPAIHSKELNTKKEALDYARKYMKENPTVSYK